MYISVRTYYYFLNNNNREKTKNVSLTIQNTNSKRKEKVKLRRYTLKINYIMNTNTTFLTEELLLII